MKRLQIIPDQEEAGTEIGRFVRPGHHSVAVKLSGSITLIITQSDQV